MGYDPGMPKSLRSDTTATRRRLRLRLRTVLLILSLFVLVLPIASLQLLRLYESVLLRQTQSSLTAQAAFAAAAYRAGLRRQLNEAIAGYGKPLLASRRVRSAALDLAKSETLPPLAEGRPATRTDGLAHGVGAMMADVLRDAKSVTGARIRILDPQGVVVASTEQDLGQSLAHNEEVREALAGAAASRLRRVGTKPVPIAAISRNTAIVVHVASPIVFDERLVGAVLLSRSPSTILVALYDKRVLLVQAAILVLAVVVGIALVAARTLVLPIRRLSRAAGRLSRQETDTFEGGRPYRVIELAELAASVEAMADNLQQRARYVRDFARHVNHEFKTPIAAMRGAMELLREHMGDMTPAQRQRFFDNVDADIKRLERLTLRLLELAYADMTDPSDDITDLRAVARGLANAAVHVAHGPPAYARIARVSAEAVLKNLIDNAVESGAERIDISATRHGDDIVLEVADDGTGVTESNRRHVFEPFFTTQRDRGGTGLGLPISRSLVRHARGDMALLPTTRGTAFRITLPAAQRA